MDVQVITNPTLNIHVTSSVSSFGSERRYDKDISIAALKAKLELVTGANSSSMILQVFDKDNSPVCTLDNDNVMLGSYPIDDGMRLHVIDKCGKLGEFEDVSKVEKYEMDAEDYAKRTDSVRAYKERMKMGRFNPEEQKKREEAKAKREEEEKELLEKMNIGNRCEVRITGQPPRRGEIKYKGTTDFQEGNWVGIQYDEPLGKNDGSVKGKRYFECPQKYGGFVRPHDVTVGDFPDMFDEEMEDEM